MKKSVAYVEIPLFPERRTVPTPPFRSRGFSSSYISLNKD